MVSLTFSSHCSCAVSSVYLHGCYLFVTIYYKSKNIISAPFGHVELHVQRGILFPEIGKCFHGPGSVCAVGMNWKYSLVYQQSRQSRHPWCQSLSTAAWNPPTLRYCKKPTSEVDLPHACSGSPTSLLWNSRQCSHFSKPHFPHL
jgi:hypothetical protein